ncbi:MAG: hypothetical protein U0271_12205 [Polyangiaceae bacterium]
MRRRGGASDRESELFAVLDGALREHRVVTLAGPTRVGKASLVRAWLARDPQRERVPVVSLAEARTIEGVLVTMSIGLGRAIPAPGLAGFGEALASGERGDIAVILGAAYAAPWLRSAVPSWLARAPRVRLLFTATSALGLEEEHRIDLEPRGRGAAVIADPWSELDEVARALLAVAAALASPTPAGALASILQMTEPRALAAAVRLEKVGLATVLEESVRVRSLGRALGRHAIDTSAWQPTREVFGRIDRFRLEQAELARDAVRQSPDERTPQPSLPSVVDALAVVHRYSFNMDPTDAARAAAMLVELVASLGAPPRTTILRALTTAREAQRADVFQRACSLAARAWPVEARTGAAFFDEAIEPSAAVAIAAGDEWRGGFAMAQIAAGLAPFADELAERAHELAQLRADNTSEGLALFALGVSAYDRGDRERALALYQRALAKLATARADRETVAVLTAFVATAEAALDMRGESRFDLAAAKSLLEKEPANERALELVRMLAEVASGRSDERHRYLRPDEDCAATTRVALRWVHRALPPEDARPSRVLVIGPSAAWLELRIEGNVLRIDLASHAALRRIVQGLDAKHASRAHLTPDEVFQAGWPGERAHHEAARARVYTAVRTLRRLGLGRVLLRGQGGYALDPALAIVRM